MPVWSRLNGAVLGSWTAILCVCVFSVARSGPMCPVVLLFVPCTAVKAHFHGHGSLTVPGLHQSKVAGTPQGHQIENVPKHGAGLPVKTKLKGAFEAAKTEKILVLASGYLEWSLCFLTLRMPLGHLSTTRPPHVPRSPHGVTQPGPADDLSWGTTFAAHWCTSGA